MFPKSQEKNKNDTYWHMCHFRSTFWLFIILIRSILYLFQKVNDIIQIRSFRHSKPLKEVKELFRLFIIVLIILFLVLSKNAF